MSTDKQNIDNELAMAILNGLSGPNACKAADERRRMIPLHVADQAVAACEKEIAALKAEVQRLTVNLGLDQKTIRNLQQIPEWSEVARLTAYSRELEAEVARLKGLAVIREGRLALPYDYDQLREENARLMAEVERLRKGSFVTAVPVGEYERLKAEVKRLRKAGDAVVADLEYLTKSGWFNKCNSVKLWNAAKEGKPSV